MIKSRQTRMPQIAGYLSITAGVIILVALVAAILFLGLIIGGFSGDFSDFQTTPYFLAPFLALPLVGLSTISILGGIAALERRSWGLALAGAICSMLFTLFLGIPAAVFIVLSRDEFSFASSTRYVKMS
jgi:F0F1-type ATP synthase assembly protein I